MQLVKLNLVPLVTEYFTKILQMIRFLLSFTLVVFMTSFLWSQNKDFYSEWLEIETLESEGKVKSALEKVVSLQRKIGTKKNKTQSLKALLFRWKFMQIIEEKSQVSILEELRTEIDNQSFPNKQILHMYLASFLEAYLSENFWKISRRTATENANLKNYQTWDQLTFQNEINRHYNYAMTPHLALANIPTKAIEELLVTVPVSRKFKPTLYDIIAHKALNYYKNSRNRLQQPKDAFSIQNNAFFSGSKNFISQEITSLDSASLLFKALKTYQQLEAIHSQRKSETAWAFNSLERLAFVKANYTGTNTSQKHLNGLQQLITEFNNPEETSEIKIAIANAYRELAFEKDENNNYKHPNYNKKAIELLTSVEKQKASINTLIKAKNLKAKILQPKLSWITQNIHLPNRIHLAKITFTNAKKAVVTAYRVPHSYKLNNYNSTHADSLTKAFLNTQKIAFTKEYILPEKDDYNTYSTEVKVPKLPLGKYVFQIQTDTITQSLKHHQLTVTELSINKTNLHTQTKYQVLNRYNGNPIGDAFVTIKTHKRGDHYTTTNRKTDNWGVFFYKKTNRYEHNNIIVAKLNDTLSIGDSSYQRDRNYNHSALNNAYKSKVLLFLDRNIYRPKQTVYFKAIAISEEQQKSGIVANSKIQLTATNPNGEKVFTTTLTTNNFGSVQGEFKLPDSGINGNFSINAHLLTPKDFNTHQKAYQNFSVEEYKRPTFEVSFLPATKVYKPLDSITVKGNAKAFLGSMVTEATVAYSVKRTIKNRYWWYRGGNANNAKQIISGTTKTDSKGIFTINFKALTGEDNTENKIYNYLIEAKVSDINGETRENSTTIKVADKNLVATIQTSENWMAPELPEVLITTTDVNGNPINVNGKIHIHKLQSTGRFLNNRPWSVPDIQQIPEKDFTTLFPHLPYTNENEPKNWKKGNSFYENTFKDSSSPSIEIKNVKNWPSGKYIISITVTDPKTFSSTKVEKAFTLNHPSQLLPADEKIFEHATLHDKNNPTNLNLNLQTSVAKLIVFAAVYDGDQLIWEDKISLKKGKKQIKVNLPKLKFPKITSVYSYQIHNKFYASQNQIDLNPEPESLIIEKNHFLNKISPSTPETWSFKIKNTSNTTVNAEALASMYDASLDTFKKSYWNTNFGFGKTYPYPNMPTGLNLSGTVATNYYSFLQKQRINNYPKEELNFYGFEFNKINSWRYRNYIKQLFLKLNPKEKANNISGIVSGNNLPLPGVSVIVNGKNEGTITDFDGIFTINATKGDIIQLSSIGFITKEIQILNQKILSIELKEDLSSLDEVIVIGYSKPKRKSKKPGSRSSKFSNAKPQQMPEGRSAELAISKDEVMAEAIGIEKEPSTKEQPSENIADFKNIETRKNLQETAFFLPNLRTNKKGEIQFEFTSPEALTRWNFRMLAHTPKAISGNFSDSTLTQKELSIIPNAPRFVREGDQLLFTAKIANLTSTTLKGSAMLQWTDPTTGESVNKSLDHNQLIKNFNINAKSNSLLSWTINIPENLTAIQYKIVAKANNFSDGEQQIIPVLSNKMLVTESIPLWVRAGETASFSLTNFNPQSSTQKPHQITLEYTSNPAWMAIKSLPYLMEFPHQCSEQTFARLYANTIATHILNSQPKIKEVFSSWKNNKTLDSPLETNTELKNILISESPWLQEAKSETQQKKRLGDLFDLEKTASAQQKNINKLRQLQKSNGGFPWFQGGHANTYITRHIVAGLGHLEKLKITNQQIKTDNIVKNAIRFLDAELLNSYNKYLKHYKNADGFYKQVALLHFAYARSFYLNRFPLKGEVKTIINKALNYQESNWQACSIYEKGILSLVLHRFRKTDTTQKIITSLIESAVNSKENGMYWKENSSSWWWYSNPITTQALLIEAFTETNQPIKYIEEMKIFLLKNKRTNRWKSTIETTNASYALLLQGKDWLSIKNNTVIKVGATKIATKKLSENQKEQGTGYFKTSWKANEISKQFKTVEIHNKSTVTGYGGYYWQYFENLDAIKSDDQNPLSIDKELYKKVTTDKGTVLKKISPTTALQIGDKITVRLLIKSDDNLEFVHLKDMRASGFEPTKVLSGYEYKDGLGYYQSTKDVASHFFIDTLRKGNYVLEYDVIANQAGSFSNGITSLQCMYAPEFSSHSAGQKVSIKE